MSDDARMGRRDEGETRAPEAAEASSVESLLYGSLRVLRRRVKVAVAVFVLFTIPAAVFVKMRPPVYQATARILVERNDDVTLISKEASGGAAGADNYFQTQSQLLRSRPIVVKAIQTIKLWEFPQFAVPGHPIGGTAEEIARTGLVDSFLAHVTVAPTPGTHLLNITFEAANPEVASRAVNALTETYINEQTTSQFKESAKVIGWIGDRLEEQRKRLDGSEAALQAYMESHDAVSVQDRQNIVVQKLSDLNSALTRSKTERMAKEALYNQLKTVREGPTAIDTLPVVLSNSVLQQLRAQLAELKQKELGLSQELGDRHPDMIKMRSEIELTTARLANELTKLTDSVKNDFVAAQAVERNLVSALEAQKREVLDLNRKSLEYGALQRQATSDREIYERLLTESQTKGVTGKTPDIKIRVVESADVPLAPIGPQNRRDVLLAAVAGLFLAVSVPLALESLDRRIKTPEDIEQRLRSVCIAMVPEVLDQTQRLMGTDANVYNEAFRRIRTSLRPRGLPDGPSRLLVTSALPQEGKSLVAGNLAIALARAGQRVLLIDGDLRRPTAHKLFGLEPAPGLSDVLRREAEPRAAIRPTSFANLFVLPCGRERSDAAELLASANFQSLLNALDTKFNWLVVDSPPVGPVADACVIGRLVQHTVFVVTADSTPAAAAAASLEQLTKSGVKVAGVILNRVDLEHSAYYYGTYYSTQYSAYYTPQTGQQRST